MTTTTQPPATSPSLVPFAAAVPHPPRPVQVTIVPTPSEPTAPWYRRALPRQPWLWLGLFIIACGWDRAIWLHFAKPIFQRFEAFEKAYWFVAPRQLGQAYVWGAVAALLVLFPFFQPDTHRVRRGLRRGVFLFLCFAVPGIIAEILKVALGRLRPEAADGHYIFAWSDPIAEQFGRGLPSSHAATAFGAAFAMSVLVPRLTPLWWILGLAGALSRIAAGAHFTSDIFLGFALALFLGRAIHALDLKNNHGVPIPPLAA